MYINIRAVRGQIPSKFRSSPKGLWAWESLAVLMTGLFWIEISDVIPGICRIHLSSFGIIALRVSMTTEIAIAFIIHIFLALLALGLPVSIQPSSCCPAVFQSVSGRLTGSVLDHSQLPSKVFPVLILRFPALIRL